jgi:hypothetical protein
MKIREYYIISVDSVVKKNGELGESTNEFTEYVQDKIDLNKIVAEKLTEEKYYKINITIYEEN